MDEIIFVIEEDAEGGYTAHAMNFIIITEGDSIEELKANIMNAVLSHFEEKDVPL